MLTLPPRSPLLRSIRKAAFRFFLLCLLMVPLSLYGSGKAMFTTCTREGIGFFLACSASMSFLVVLALGMVLLSGILLLFAQMFYVGGATPSADSGD